MKKALKAIVSLLILSALTVCSITEFYADTYGKAEGYIFQNDNEKNIIEIFGYYDIDTDVMIPRFILNKPVTAIGKKAFFENTEITSVSFEDAVYLSKLDYYSFYGCSNLVSVDLSHYVNSLGFGNFFNCSNLETVNFGSRSKINEISDYCFYNCSSLNNILLPDTVASIGDNSFGNCTSLTSITIPKATTYIANNAFLNSPDVTIRGYFDSYAQEYAEAHNIPFEPIIEYMLGDADMDGDITISDVTAIQKSLVDVLTLTEEAEYLADVDKNGTVNIDDATNIQKYLAEIINSFE